MGWFSIGNCYILWKGVHWGGGHSHMKGVWGCAAVMTPFFQAIRRSLAYQFTVNAPLLWLPFSCFGKFFAFSVMFWPKFYLSKPKFFKENPLPRPYILKPPWHTSTRKKLSALPGRNFFFLPARYRPTKGPFTNTCKGVLMQKIFIVKIFCPPLRQQKKKKIRAPFLPWKLRVKAVEKHINSIFNGKSVVIFSGTPPLQGSKFLRAPLFASAPLTSVCERSLTSVKRFLVKVFHDCSPCFRVWNIYGILVTIIWPNLGFAGVLLTALHKHYGFFLFHF